ncbi:MAG: AMP-binding protein [Cytophagaceae bacterium]|nr:AMP-binding protein [Cytophagaceae bacterium]
MIRLIPGQPLPEPQSPYDAQALDFCQKWRAGQGVFTLQTSGSTGKPKPIKLTRQQLIASARMTGDTFGLMPGDHALCCLNVAYIAGIMMLVRAMELNLLLTVVEPSTHPLKNLNSQEPLDFAAFVPLQLQTILENPAENLPILHPMKAILVGGATVSATLETAIQAIEAPVFSTYGMTETVSHVATRRLNGVERSERYHLLEGVGAGSDDRACLWVRGAITNEEIIQTNDVVKWVDTQTFDWLGRFDNIINSGGVKVQPERIENAAEVALRRVGFSGRFFVFGLPDERLGQQVALVVEGAPLTLAQQISVDESLREGLSAYEAPRRWVAVREFFETPTGKIDKRKTVEKFTESAD